MVRLTLRSLTVPLALALLISGCRDGEQSQAQKDTAPGSSPPALAKPAGADDGKPQATAETPEKPREAAADVAPTTKDEVADADEDDAEDVDAAQPKRSAGKRKKVGARRRASSGGDVVAPPEAGAPTELKLKRIQLSQAIEGREPVDPDETFSARDTDALYAFIEVQNPEKRAGKIFVSFVPPMGAPSKVTLKVGDVTRWRTWAKRKSPKAVGTWHVVVSDEKGRELGRRSFEVTE